MSHKDLIIINNEKISKKRNNSFQNSFFCHNIDIKTIPEDLSKNFNVALIARYSKNEKKAVTCLIL